MTPAELRALLAKATKGPWDQLDHDIFGAERIADDREIAQFQLVDDANLVFAAVNALPALLDVVEAAATMDYAWDRLDKCIEAGFAAEERPDIARARVVRAAQNLRASLAKLGSK